MLVQLFGVDEAAVDHFPAPVVNPFAFGRHSVLVYALFGFLPGVPDHHFHAVLALGALVSQRAFLALGRVGLKIPIAAVDGAVVQVDKALGLVVACHEAAVRIDRADLGFLDVRLVSRAW